MKKQITKTLALILALIMLVMALPMTASAANVIESGKCGDNLTWTFDDEGTFTVSGTGDMYDYDDYDGSPLYKFTVDEKCGLKNIVIENGATSIGDNAFLNTPCKNITIPDSVKSIGYASFSYSAVENIEIPDSVTYIDDYAFAYCFSLKNVTIPENVTKISEGAFICPNLTKIVLPANITTIEENAFALCDSITDVYFCGNEEQWNSISVDMTNDGNISLLNANIHFNYCTHPNKDGNGICDKCEKLLVDCGCMCHNDNDFMSILWKIIRFFYQIFGMNKYCECGMAHY